MDLILRRHLDLKYVNSLMERFFETNSSVVFPKRNLCFHKNFIKRFKNKTIIDARRLLIGKFSHKEQDDIIHYLKIKRIIF